MLPIIVESITIMLVPKLVLLQEVMVMRSGEDEANIYSLHTINITRTPGIFDKTLIRQIYIDNWIRKKDVLQELVSVFLYPKWQRG